MNVQRTALRLVAVGWLLVAATGTAFAADAVPTVDVSGVVLDTEGQPAEVDSARVVEFETPDSEGITTIIDVADDGTFTVALRQWGTLERRQSPNSSSRVLGASRTSSTKRAAPWRPRRPGRLSSRSRVRSPSSQSKSSSIRNSLMACARRSRRHLTLSPRREVRRSRSRRPTPAERLAPSRE